MSRKCIISASLLIGLSAVSCGHDSGPSSSANAVTPQTPPSTPQKHWIQNEQLKSTMDQISKLHASLPNGLPEDVESPSGRQATLAAANAASLADALAKTSLLIPDAAMNSKPLSEADRRGLMAEAQTLHDQALQLRDAAQKFQVERMQKTLDSISSTCLSCHSRYRDLTGQLDLRKALAPSPNPLITAGAIPRQ